MKHSLSCITLSIAVCFLTGCASNSPVGTETLENNNAETETITERTPEITTITETPETTTIIEIDPVEEKFGDRLDQFQGEWKQLKSNWHLIIDGDDITAAYYEDYGDVTEPIEKRYFDLDENDNIVIVRNLNYKGEKAFYNCEINENGNLLVKDTKTPIVNEYKKVRNIDEITLTIPETENKKSPSVGMTKQDIYNSTWGGPKKINKTETSAGTHEQWVYDKGYIYFDNGIVTSIQKT